MTDLTSLSPAEIDALWAPLHYATVEAYWAEADARFAVRKLEGQIETSTFGRFETARDVETKLRQIENRLRKLHETWSTAYALEIPFEAEWARRNGWTRAYLVTNNGGHVHTSTRCSTCYPSTRFEWLTEQSGKSQDEIVELAGERACTVCYPSAPVEIRNRPTQLFGEAEIAARKVREEKAAAKAAKDAEKIVVAAGYNGKRYDHTFNTARGATNAIASTLLDLTWYGETHPSAARWIKDIELIREALAAKGVEYDYDKALAAARKKAIRQGRPAARY